MPLPSRAPEKKLNPEVERLVYQLKVIRQEAEGLVVGMSGPQLDWTPEPGRWSVAQCFAHLNETNRKMADGMEASIQHGRQSNMTGEGPFVYGFVSRLFLRMIEPPVKRRFKAPAAFSAAPGQPWERIQAAWVATHDRLDDLLQQANGLDLARIKAQSPASNWLKYPLGMAFWIQTAHDRRHLWQARQIINDPRFPRTKP
jgi:DinB superfamily